MNTKEFIKKSIILHGNKYNYDLVNYINNLSKVKIYCNKCKEYFLQSPKNHSQGKGCRKCGIKININKNRIQLEEFISKATKIHGDKYGYDKVTCNGYSNQIIIFCKQCNKYFKQRMGDHLDGHGCRVCSINEKRKGTDEFIKSAIKQHGSKYNYNKVEYNHCVQKVKILCNRCRKYFWQTPKNHIKGEGCPICARKLSVNRSLTTEEFIIRAIKIHGNKFNYSQAKYIKYSHKVKILCNECGKYFYQTPSSHLQGNGCHYCTKTKVKTSLEEFIEKSIKVHGNKYDYSKVKYKDTKTKVKIYCKSCKYEFLQTPITHKSGAGCPKCAANNLKINEKEIIERAIKVHGSKYNYNTIKYKNIKSPIDIYCNTCNKYFKQLVSAHLAGSGCPDCANNRQKLGIKEVINRAYKIHGDKYNYDEAKYHNYDSKIKILCKKCNKYFDQTVSNHIAGSGCPLCCGTKLQEEVYKYISTIVDAEYCNRKLIKPYELDIYIPANKLAVEVNGTYWHSDKFHDKYYHYNKYKICKESGVELIQIFENEWKNNGNVVKNFINNKIGINEVINNVSLACPNQLEINKFIKSNSIIKIKHNQCVGLTSNKLLAIMLFNNDIITGYIESIGYTVSNGFNILSSQYLKTHNYGHLIYYDNLRMSINHNINNYKYDKFIEPDFCYTKSGSIYSKFYYPYKKLTKYDKLLSAEENMRSNGYNKIWDAGYNKLLII